MTLPTHRGWGPAFLYAGQPMHILAGQDGLPPGFAAMELTVPPRFALPPRFAGPIPRSARLARTRNRAIPVSLLGALWHPAGVKADFRHFSTTSTTLSCRETSDCRRGVILLRSWPDRTARGAAACASVTLSPPVPGSYCMDAATMSLELHERGIHVV
jgi:hypothetical protein